MTIQEFFEKAITMDKDDMLLIPCDTEQERESIRVRLYQLRKRARQDGLMITRQTINGDLFIGIKKGVKDGFIVKANGEMIPVVSSDNSPPSLDASLERVVKLAQEDGLSLMDFILEIDGSYPEDVILQEWNKQKEAKNA